MVHIQRSSKGEDKKKMNSYHKILIIDLAELEQIDEFGVHGHILEKDKFINLSLNSLGKCINALAENSTHIPTREPKFTRLLSDSFGGIAQISLIIITETYGITGTTEPWDLDRVYLRLPHN
ncbi:hypothetical protein IEQ34_006720 [Dendrobium chrysotoxum]|uniref:Kinesin motor domain-containing protein n=1 Tax=Dendrobium chrysotoxum TaxID=161865 RepID=A0AAV7GR69_DENCH|nr:hypothetical protein IEQ34_006720 [Dendrobium chrysotoxum]